MIGRVVQNAAGDKIGTIKDIAIDHGGVQAYIIGVGGFLGLGGPLRGGDAESDVADL